MEKFTASNGVEIKVRHSGGVFVACSGDEETHSLSIEETAALREFFRTERDAELGRWRWPENPDYVVYGWGPDRIAVFNESTGGQYTTSRESNRGGDGWAGAASAYFAAHPVRRPWEDAKPGEVWVLTIDDPGELQGDAAFEVAQAPKRFHSANWGSYDLDAECITDARRVWPEQTGEQP